MSIGSVLQTAQKQEASGPPFVPASAKNGLSVAIDGSGAIVLGQNVGQALNPAALLSNREIPMAGFSLSLNTAPTQFMRFLQQGLGMPTFQIQQDSNNAILGFSLQNLSAGVQSAAHADIYNNIASNIRIGVTGTAYTGAPGQMLTLPADASFVTAESFALTQRLYIASNAGLFFDSAVQTGVVQPAMRYLNNRLIIAAPNDSFDYGIRLQVSGSGSVSSLPLGIFRALGTGGLPSTMYVAQGSSNYGLQLQRAGANGASATLTFFKNRGTDFTTLVAPLLNDIQGRILMQSIDSGLVIRDTAAIQAYVAGAPGAGFVPTGWNISTTNDAGFTNLRYVFSQNGGLGIATGVPVLGVDIEVGQLRLQGTLNNSFLVVSAAVAPPLAGVPPVFTDFFGGNTNALGAPNAWIRVNLAGVEGVVPWYTL